MSTIQTEPVGRWRALVLIALVELACMSLWFGVSSVTPALAAELDYGEAAISGLTIAVQLGFVAGTLLSALLNISDVMPVRRLLWVSAFAAGAINLSFLVVAAVPSLALLVRFLTGMFLGGIYPPGMKLMATWFRRGRGLALGVLVGSLTLGKASPYLVNALGLHWESTVVTASVASFSGGLIVLFGIREGPLSVGTAPFDPGQIVTILKNPGLRLANFGYFGHMWELYAMWTWFPLMLRESVAESGASPRLAEVGSFLVIGSGAIGCVVAGLVADRVGRTMVTSVAMTVSGFCCVFVGFFYAGSPVLLLLFAVVWGATIVADSAQFSASVTELGDPRYAGTALTLQTCIGFLLTTISIALIPWLVDAIGWRWAFIALAPGPLLGTSAMLRLRALPMASRLAGGRR